MLGKDRTYDFNVDGLAHFGLIPDMLQDLKNVGLSQGDFQSLFSSAESYIEMWEKTERVSGAHFDASRCKVLCKLGGLPLGAGHPDAISLAAGDSSRIG